MQRLLIVWFFKQLRIHVLKYLNGHSKVPFYKWTKQLCIFSSIEWSKFLHMQELSHGVKINNFVFYFSFQSHTLKILKEQKVIMWKNKFTEKGKLNIWKGILFDWITCATGHWAECYLRSLHKDVLEQMETQ